MVQQYHSPVRIYKYPFALVMMVRFLLSFASDVLKNFQVINPTLNFTSKQCNYNLSMFLNSMIVKKFDFLEHWMIVIWWLTKKYKNFNCYVKCLERIISWVWSRNFISLFFVKYHFFYSFHSQKLIWLKLQLTFFNNSWIRILTAFVNQHNQQ